MPVEQTIQPINVAAATLLIQLLLVTLLAITSSLFRGTSYPFGFVSDALPESLPQQLRRAPLLMLAIATFAILLITDELFTIWSPLFQGVGINTIATVTAVPIVFLLDLALVGYLVYVTGGSRSSPFLSALFTIPALALFLRLPPVHFLGLAALAVAAYLALFIPRFREQVLGSAAGGFLNVACLLLSMFTGYITRPVPLTELSAPTKAIAAPVSSSAPSTSSRP